MKQQQTTAQQQVQIKRKLIDRINKIERQLLAALSGQREALDERNKWFEKWRSAENEVIKLREVNLRHEERAIWLEKHLPQGSLAQADQHSRSEWVNMLRAPRMFADTFAR